MLKKTLRFVVNTIFVLLPFFPVTENFFLTVDHDTIGSYLLVCMILSVLLLLFGFFIHYSGGPGTANQAKALPAAWLLVVLGIIVMIPLHMGPPKQSEELLMSAAEEKFRYTMLLLAVAIFVAGTIAAIGPFWKKLTIAEKAVIVPLIITIPISTWDYYDSFLFSSRLTDWINSGKPAGDFFPSYHFHENWRAAGRILLYVVAAWLSIILYKQEIIRKWVTLTLSLFCFTGLGFCLACVFIGTSFYFPFMVPAIAMAPAYWLGIALLGKPSVELKGRSRRTERS